MLEISKKSICGSHYCREEKLLYTGIRGNLFYLTDNDNNNNNNNNSLFL